MVAAALALAVPVAGQAATLTSTGNFNRQAQGLFFDLVAGPGTVTVESIDAFIVTAGSTAYQVWYREGGYAGFTQSQDGWQLIGSADAPDTGLSVEPFSFDFTDIAIAPGNRAGFYLFAIDNPATPDPSGLGYSQGDPAALLTAANADLALGRSTGQSGFFSGRSNSPRDFVGTIHYTTVAAVPEPATWAITVMGVGVAGRTLRRRRRRLAPA